MNDELVDFRELFLVVWRRRWLVIGLAAALGAASLAWALKTTPYFRSTSKIICKTGGAGDQKLAGLAALAGIQLGGGSASDPSDYFEDVIDDDEFLERILARRWPYRKDTLLLEEIWRMKPDTAQPDWRYRFQQKRLERIRKGKYIQLKKSSNGLLSVVTLFEDPVLARDVNMFVVESLNEYVISGVVTQAKVNRKFIESQIKALEEELARSENALVRFRQRNMGVQAPDLMAEEMRLRRDATLNQELYLQMKKQLELAKIEEKKDQPVIEVVSKPVVPVNKFKPSKRKLVLMGIGAGIILGLLAAFMHHWYLGLKALPAGRRPA